MKNADMFCMCYSVYQTGFRPESTLWKQVFNQGDIVVIELKPQHVLALHRVDLFLHSPLSKGS